MLITTPTAVFFPVHVDTAVSDIEDSFRSFTSRADIAIILINQYVSEWISLSLSLPLNLSPSPPQIAEMIRHIIDQHDKAIPAVLEIPSKDQPYDPNKDSILRRAKVWKKARININSTLPPFRGCSMLMISDRGVNLVTLNWYKIEVAVE